MKIDRAFSELVGLIYDGPLEAVPWQTFLAAVREPFEADIAAMFLQPPTPGSRLVMLVDGGRAEGIASYRGGQYMLDPFYGLPEGQVVTLHEFISTEELRDSDFYRLTMKPSGLYDFMGADLRVEGEFDARFRLSRYEGRTRFGDREKQLLAELMPHLQRAICIHARLNRVESERDLYAGAVQQLALGTVLLDETGTVLECNSLASELLAQEDGIRVAAGRLQLGSRPATAQLDEAVEQVLAQQRQATPSMVEVIRVPRPSGRADLGLVIRAVPTSHFSEGRAIPAVAVFISDPEQQAGAGVESLQRLLGLTQTEARLSLLLADGFTLDEAADTMGVSRNTARTHLRAVFSKTGVSRQTQLVRLVLRSVAPLA